LCGGARYTRLAGGDARWDEMIVERVMIDRNKEADDGERYRIAECMKIFFECGDAEDEYLRVHGNPLVPAKYTWGKLEYFRVVQTTEDCHDGLQPSKL